MKKFALVTGAASGFGLEFAKLLANDSYKLVLVDFNKDSLSRAKQDFENKFNVEVQTLNIDLALPHSAYTIFNTVEHLNIEVLINNAGYGVYGFFSNTSWIIEEKMIEIHIQSLTLLTKLFLPGMISRNCGKIMNVSSVAAFQAGPLMAVYYATKAYILSFTEALANELKNTGVSATAFCPGQTATNFQKTVAEYSNSKQTPVNWLTAKLVPAAKSGYQAMLAGRSLAIHGKLNYAIVQMNRILPRKLAANVVRQIQEKLRE